jgi:phosphohistidine phosphatase SixA
MTLESDIKKVWTFGVSHLVLVGMLCVALIGGVYLYDSKRADSADAQAALSAIQAKQQEQVNAQLQQQNVQLQAVIATDKVQQEQTAAALISATQALKAATAKQVASVPTLAPPALATEWGQLAQEPTPSIDTAGNFQIPLPLAQKSVVALIQVSSLEKQNQQLTDANTAQAKATADADKQLDSEKTAHTSDNTTCVVEKKALGDQITKLKADNRKKNIKYMIFGGFIVETFKVYFTKSL